jgi:hypothetical protein
VADAFDGGEMVVASLLAHGVAELSGIQALPQQISRVSSHNKIHMKFVVCLIGCYWFVA